MRVILPNRPFRMNENFNETNVKKLIARINNLSTIDKVEIKSFNRLDFYFETLNEVEYDIFGRENKLLSLK